MCIDEVAVLREAAAEVRAVGKLVGEQNGPVSRPIAWAGPETWRGPFAEGFLAALHGHERGLQGAGESLLRVAGWLEQVADERAAAAARAISGPQGTL